MYNYLKIKLFSEGLPGLCNDQYIATLNTNPVPLVVEYKLIPKLLIIPEHSTSNLCLR